MAVPSGAVKRLIKCCLHHVGRYKWRIQVDGSG
ncbi:unnamed protein product [Acanthoscelides obtectus]|uniref:Uncharacterized protein n=1 Tax=Acanthoscelides obtectus TaxID=200917 RepID=A0A9P0JYX8_ACAOB|nr:unnamed protein product [Acanthoscelides obtectus]CAK1657118.1 hypothetical protein AOBTE_LOCUS20130 [Acanthoscelides obtectus]